jgi:TonB-linked SusC/RagA family outer membrane protein
MKKLFLLIVLFVFVSGYTLLAQTIVITGRVTSSTEGAGPIPGVTVVVKGTTIGSITDVNGKYSISAPANATTLIFSYIGMKTLEVSVSGRKVIDATMESDLVGLNEVVVTALGISRTKKSLGYATQEVQGEAVSTVKSDNFLNSLSGKVAGVVITRNTNFGGSTNIQVRGASSLTGDNQALFVVDGVPVSNRVTNTVSQSQTGSGYDYGNAASDINPDDIESINVLKGAAATALYGSRAATGVIMITTKKGNQKKNGIGITINSNFTLGTVDKSTFPKYQNKYGAGYGSYYDGPGGYWYMRDLVPAPNGDGVFEQWVTTSEDASYGAKFDPSLMVYQWDAVDPQSPNYQKATPWVAAKNGPITFFNKSQTYTNTVAIENSFDKGNYRLSYTNYKDDGIVPNSSLKKNNLLMNGTWKVDSRLTVSGSANFIQTDGKGRNETGYNDNYMGSWRQWFETNVDIQELKAAYFTTKRNITWNWADPSDEQPIYWDNPYWMAYENYETDSRDRFIGYMTVNYKLTDWLELFGRAATDFYSALEEERKAIGTVPGAFGIGTGQDGSTGRSDQGSGYLRRDYFSRQDNYDLMLNINKDLTSTLNLKGILGANINRQIFNRIISATNGGLAIPRLYSLQNSIDPIPYPKELAQDIGINGIYGSASLGYRNYLFLDATLRRDHSSTLPVSSSVYYYPSVSGSIIFSELVKQQWLSFGKVRLNYAQVGNSAGFDQIQDEYTILTPFNSPMSAVATTKKDPDLKPEKTNSLETGLEMYFLNRRAGFDLALYKTNTTNQILPLAVSSAAGYFYKNINAGEIENKGIELALNFVPVKTSNFSWELSINWSKNVNKVISLYPGVENYQLGAFQGGVTINAHVGQPWGIIEGTDYTYLNGQRVVNPANGRYVMTTTNNNNLGRVSPDWKGGLLNTFTYKNWKLSCLIDMSQGGHIWSLDMYYGMATGLYPETAGNNDLGNPVRDPIVWVDPADHSKGYASTSGGFINPGVNPDGTKNTSRIDASNYGSFGYVRIPEAAFSYDASYVKLREASISYSVPAALLQNFLIKGIDLSIVGSNLWIISKHLPYADPESGLGSGNLLGYSTGSLPTTRNIGFNIKFTF